MADRESNVFKTVLAERAERYDEMVEAMRKVASLHVESTVEERKLLFVAYKNVVESRRESLRKISSIEQKEVNIGWKLEVIKQYKLKVEKELKNIYQDIIDILYRNLILGAEESEVFSLETSGDIYCYLAEIASFEDLKAAVMKLPPTHFIRKIWEKLDEGYKNQNEQLKQDVQNGKKISSLMLLKIKTIQKEKENLAQETMFYRSLFCSAEKDLLQKNKALEAKDKMLSDQEKTVRKFESILKEKQLIWDKEKQKLMLEIKKLKDNNLQLKQNVRL